MMKSTSFEVASTRILVHIYQYQLSTILGHCINLSLIQSENYAPFAGFVFLGKLFHSRKTHYPLKIKANLIQSVTITMHRIREVSKRLAEIKGLEKTAITRRRMFPGRFNH